MIKQELLIINKLGLHARAAAKFVTQASQFHSQIWLARGPRQVNGKSIMGVMMLAASKGTTLTLLVDGPDEDAAVAGLLALVQNRFGEAE